ncbi:MAG: hypothetical protein Q9180_001694 [Flavoplaca navasiana]
MYCVKAMTWSQAPRSVFQTWSGSRIVGFQPSDILEKLTRHHREEQVRDEWVYLHEKPNPGSVKRTEVGCTDEAMLDEDFANLLPETPLVIKAISTRASMRCPDEPSAPQDAPSARWIAQTSQSIDDPYCPTLITSQAAAYPDVHTDPYRIQRYRERSALAWPCHQQALRLLRGGALAPDSLAPSAVDVVDLDI